MSLFSARQIPNTDIHLSAHLTEGLPPTPPSSPRHSLTRQESFDIFSVRPLLDEVWSANFDLEISTKPPGIIRPYTIPSYRTPPSSDEGNEDEPDLLESQTKSCEASDKTISTIRFSDWSQRSSSCSETDATTEDGTSNHECFPDQIRSYESPDKDQHQTRLYQSWDEEDETPANPHPSSDKDDEIPPNLRRSDWPVQTRYFYPTACTTHSRSSVPITPPSVYRSNASRSRHPTSAPITRSKFGMTSPLTSPKLGVPSLLASPKVGTTSPLASPKLGDPFRLPRFCPSSLSATNHRASQSPSQPSTPTIPALSDANERSFMDFDDSDAEGEGVAKKYSSSGSLSRLFDKKRKGERQQKRRIGRSLSEVFGVLSCSKD